MARGHLQQPLWFAGVMCTFKVHLFATAASMMTSLLWALPYLGAGLIGMLLTATRAGIAMGG